MLSKKWTMAIRNWGVAFSRFAIVFEGRIPIY
jgi:transposase-like protein